MKWWRKNKTLNGFTVVELLIVVAVIAILAVVTIVAYNGITAKAAHGKYIKTLDNYATGFLAEVARQNSAFPVNLKGCLGSPADYPATSKFNQGACIGLGEAATGTYSDFISIPGVEPDKIETTKEAINAGGGPYNAVTKFRGAYIEYLTRGTTADPGKADAYLLYTKPTSGCIGQDATTTNLPPSALNSPVFWWTQFGEDVCFRMLTNNADN